MISEKTQRFAVKVVALNNRFTDDDYPIYLIKRVLTEADNDYCLLFCLSFEKYIILNPKLKRYNAIKIIQRHMETASYQTIEIK